MRGFHLMVVGKRATPFPPIHPNRLKPISPPSAATQHWGKGVDLWSERTVRWQWVPSGGGGALTGTKGGVDKAPLGMREGGADEHGGNLTPWLQTLGPRLAAPGHFLMVVAEEAAVEVQPRVGGDIPPPDPSGLFRRIPPPRDKSRGLFPTGSTGRTEDYCKEKAECRLCANSWEKVWEGTLPTQDAATFGICSVQIIWDAGGGGAEFVLSFQTGCNKCGNNNTGGDGARVGLGWGEPGADVAELPGAIEAAVPHRVAAGPLRWIPPPHTAIGGGGCFGEDG